MCKIGTIMKEIRESKEELQRVRNAVKRSAEDFNDEYDYNE